MNNFFKIVVQFLLKWLAKIYLWRVKPLIIVIAGTTGRHWVKEAISDALKEKKLLVRINQKNFNAEIGLPLSILGLSSGEGSFWKWLKIFYQGIKKVFSFKIKTHPFGEFLVLEMAIDRPASMNYLLSIVKPKIAIFTTITMIYQENFEDLDEIALEYKKLIKALPWNGLAILNFDDERMKNLGKFYSGKSFTYGFGEGADFRAKELKKIKDGQVFDLEIKQTKNQESRGPRRIKVNRFGNHHIYASLAAEIIKENFKMSTADFFNQILSRK